MTFVCGDKDGDRSLHDTTPNNETCPHTSVMKRPVPIVVVPIALLIWCVLWLNFTARDLYKRGLLNEYKILARSDAEGKRAYTYGKRFYEFLKFAEAGLPRETFYDFEGIKDFSLESRRGVYYLYPDTKMERPVYILVYEKPGYTKAGFARHVTLDNGRFILKRK